MVLAELVLVTRILGLVIGEQPINVQVDKSVASVDIVLDGNTVAALRRPPWRTVINFGDALKPHELIAVAYDAQGNELARDRQVVNLARPPAEAAIDLSRDPDGTLRAKLRWQHIGYEDPKTIAVRLDGKPIGSHANVALPALEPGGIHLLEAELTFPGGVVAKKELVFGGVYTEEVPSELTGVLVQQNEVGKADAANCFRIGGRRIAAAAIEKPMAQVLFVRSSDPGLAQSKLHLPIPTNRMNALVIHRLYALDGMKMRFIWPVAREARSDEEKSVSNLFLRSELTDGGWGTARFLTRIGGPKNAKDERFADAVAVAAVQTLAAPQRRAVVLVLGGEPDESRHTAREVRRYLERIGVPLYVWSIVGLREDIVEAWAPVVNISNATGLRNATKALRADLDRQRIAWLPVDPLEALQVETTPDCAFVPLVR